MSVAVVADAHLGGYGGAAEPLLGQLERLPEEGCERLLLLGDLFQVWVGLPRFETEEIRRVTDVLRDLRHRGVAIDYVEGNRDFFLAGSVYEEAFDRLAEELDVTVDGRRYLAVHGDGLDDADRRYRLWRRFSKSTPVRFFMRTLPGAIARRLVAGTEQRLAETNFKHKIRIPEEVIRAYARRRLAEGYDELLLGHFHEERRWRVPTGTVWLLEAWFTSRRVEWLAEDRP